MSTDRAAPLLGFDFGLRRIGVAIGQPLTGQARPLTTLDAQQGAPQWSQLAALLTAWRPAALVVGIPYHLDGSEHQLTCAARRFRNRLAGRYNLPVHEVDERLTSDEAERQLRAGGTHNRHAVAAACDPLAAALILQQWLDSNPT